MSGWAVCCDRLSLKSVAFDIKALCTERIEKYGLHSVKSGACKGCPYKYRGTEEGICCIFGDLPNSWSDEDINKKYTY